MKTRQLVEILNDLVALLIAAFTSDKGIELLDELFQYLGLPDLFPGIDGFSDGKTETVTPAEVAEARMNSQPSKSKGTAPYDPTKDPNFTETLKHWTPKGD